MAKFQIGDKVKFLNAVGGGTVTRVTDDFVFVQDDTGFDMPMPPNELIRMADMSGVAKVFNQDVPGQFSTAEEAKKAVEAESKAAAKEAELNRKLKGRDQMGATAHCRDQMGATAQPRKTKRKRKRKNRPYSP